MFALFAICGLRQVIEDAFKISQTEVGRGPSPLTCVMYLVDDAQDRVTSSSSA